MMSEIFAKYLTLPCSPRLRHDSVPSPHGVQNAGSCFPHSPLLLEAIHKILYPCSHSSISHTSIMAPQITEDEIDDLIYFSRAGELSDLTETLKSLADREKTTPAEILVVARDEGKSTCLHMATGNGHLGMLSSTTNPPCSELIPHPRDCPTTSSAL